MAVTNAGIADELAAAIDTDDFKNNDLRMLAILLQANARATLAVVDAIEDHGAAYGPVRRTE